MEQSWRGDFDCCFKPSKIEGNQWLGVYLGLPSGVISTAGNKHSCTEAMVIRRTSTEPNEHRQ